MKKILAACGGFLIFTAGLFAGDVASFVDKGFSEDGKTYVFAQYGRTDKKYQGWAEIYQVNIEKNAYVPGGVFRTKPSAVTADKHGISVFEALEAKSFYYFKNLKLQKADPDHVLYICDEPGKSGTDTIEFTDFRNSNVENPTMFHVQLVPTVIGKGKKIKSSFYINVEKRDGQGNVISSYKVGSPDITRDGISGYKIERIMCDNSEKNFIFVVEKIMEDDAGVSVRYMVEAAEIK